MTKPKPRDQAWAARKVAAATTKPSEDEAARLRSRDALLAAFRRRRLDPLFVEGAFDADAVTRHFLA